MRWPRRPDAGRHTPPHEPDRDTLFSEVLTAALASEDIRLSVTNTTAVSVRNLHQEMAAEKAAVLGQAEVSEAEKQYLAAHADAAASVEERPQYTLRLWSTVALAVLMVLSACLMYGWSAALRGPVGSYREASVLSAAVLGRALGSLAALVSIGVLTYAGVRAVGRFLWASAGAAQVAAPVAAAALIAVITLPVLGLGTHNVVTHLSGSDPGWGWLAFFGAATAYALFFMGAVRSWWARLLRPLSDEESRARAEEALAAWRDEMADETMRRLRPKLNELVQRQYALTLQEFGKDGLRQVRDLRYHVPTPAQDRLVTVVRDMTDGSVALSGPRGVGKTDLLEALRGGYCGVQVRLSIKVNAPVAYDKREFMLHLFAAVCERVCEADPPMPRVIRAKAEENLEWIRYLQTVSSEVAAAMPSRMGGLGIKRGVTRTRQPLTYPEIVEELRGFLERVTHHLDGTGPGPRLLIAIDELDRIQPAADAKRFLSEIKVIFDVRFCLFLLTVSDDALHEAGLASVGRQDAFYSAIDEVVRVEPLEQRVAESLLASRVVGPSHYFSALFNCLACGIPRDLLRVARAAILFATPEERTDIESVAARLVERELFEINGSVVSAAGPFDDIGALQDAAEPLSATDPALANRLYFLDTVLGVFATEKLRAHGRTALEAPASDPISFTALALTGSKIGTADLQARSALQDIRTEWKLTDVPPLG